MAADWKPPSVTVAAVIERDGRFLVVEENYDGARVLNQPAGHLDPGEISVVVAVSCPHRDHAFEACRWLIDTLKQVVPIWKKEVWADGTEEWVHPGLDVPSATGG